MGFLRNPNSQLQTVLARQDPPRQGGWGESGLSRLSTSPHHTTDCKLDSVVFAGICECRCDGLSWTCIVWAELSTPYNFWVPSHRHNSATGEQTRISHSIILIPNRPVVCLTDYCQATSWETQTSQFLMSLVWRGRISNLGRQHPERTL